jgi:molybdopterin molybdotransferase
MTTYKLTPHEETLAILGKLKLHEPRIEERYIWDAYGMISAEEIRAPKNLPEKPLAAMDGYAVSTNDLDKYEKLLISEVKIFPGTKTSVKLRSGEAIYVSTGSPLPEGADAVVRVESARVEDRYIIPISKIYPGKDVFSVGEVVREGEVIIRRGDMVTPYIASLLIQLGIYRIKVYRPRITLFSVGDELISYRELGSEGLRDTSTLMIQLVLSRFSDTRYLGVLPDDKEVIKRRIIEASQESDVIVTVGGSSAGEKDLVKEVIREEGELLFEGVDINIIKPTGLGLVNNKPIVTAPGLCVGASLALHEYILRLIEILTNSRIREELELELLEDVIVERKMNSAYLFKVIDYKYAKPLRWGMALCKELAEANGYSFLRRDREYKRGDKVRVTLFLK